MTSSQTPVRFTKIDDLNRGEHRFLVDNDDCSFLGEYTARGGYSRSETNNQIISLKMKPGAIRQNPYRGKYKLKAIAYWATKLSVALPSADAHNAVWVPVPGSCPPGHSEYDDRLVKVLRRAYGPSLPIASGFLKQIGERVAAHDADHRPDPDQLRAEWALDFSNLPPQIERFIVFDDVISRGATFRAAKTLLIERFPDVPVAGVFLARTVHDDPPLLGFSFFEET